MEDKSLKMKLKHKLLSLQLCRPNKPSNYPHNPAKYSPSPINSKTFDISYPSFSLPSPPPTTPETSSLNPLQSSENPIKPRILHKSDEYSEYYWRKDGRWHVASRLDDQSNDPYCKTYCKSNLGDCSSREIMSSDSRWSSSDSHDVIYTDKDTGTLLSATIRFSNDAFSELCSSQKAEDNERKGKARGINSRSCPKLTLCHDNKEDMVRSPSVMRKILPPSAAKGKAAKSVAVVKKSEHPLEDFKTSMMEMVLENQMFEAKELEELLQCFLSLNTREHHGVIVEAFAELWEALFSEFSPTNRTASKCA